jgi:hypothetical protein
MKTLSGAMSLILFWLLPAHALTEMDLVERYCTGMTEFYNPVGHFLGYHPSPPPKSPLLSLKVSGPERAPGSGAPQTGPPGYVRQARGAGWRVPAGSGRRCLSRLRSYEWSHAPALHSTNSWW